MRVCQPSPVARKALTTSRDRRSETRCLVGAFCGPRSPGRRRKATAPAMNLGGITAAMPAMTRPCLLTNRHCADATNTTGLPLWGSATTRQSCVDCQAQLNVPGTASLQSYQRTEHTLKTIAAVIGLGNVGLPLVVAFGKHRRSIGIAIH